MKSPDNPICKTLKNSFLKGQFSRTISGSVAFLLLLQLEDLKRVSINLADEICSSVESRLIRATAEETMREATVQRCCTSVVHVFVYVVLSIILFQREDSFALPSNLLCKRRAVGGNGDFSCNVYCHYCVQV